MRYNDNIWECKQLIEGTFGGLHMIKCKHRFWILRQKGELVSICAYCKMDGNIVIEI